MVYKILNYYFFFTMSNTIFKSLDVSVAIVRYAWWPFLETQWIEFFFAINGFIIIYISPSGH
jgi:hypothetical protein